MEDDGGGNGRGDRERVGRREEDIQSHDAKDQNQDVDGEDVGDAEGEA